MNKDTQLLWYDADLCTQDAELMDFINLNEIKRIKYFGDIERIRTLINKVDDFDCQLCVYMVNSPFKLSTIIENCSAILNQFNSLGYLYLSLNKFLLQHEFYNNIEDDYDNAILFHVTKKIPFRLIKYYSGNVDGGIKFNWIHPLTRFYFSNENIR